MIHQLHILSIQVHIQLIIEDFSLFCRSENFKKDYD